MNFEWSKYVFNQSLPICKVSFFSWVIFSWGPLNIKITKMILGNYVVGSWHFQGYSYFRINLIISTEMFLFFINSNVFKFGDTETPNKFQSLFVDKENIGFWSHAQIHVLQHCLLFQQRSSECKMCGKNTFLLTAQKADV